MGARHCSRHGEEQCISYLFSGLKQHPLIISLPLWTGIGAGDTWSSAQGVRGFSQGSGRGWERSLRKAQRVGAAPFTSSGLFSEGQFSPWLPVCRRSPSEVTVGGHHQVLSRYACPAWQLVPSKPARESLLARRMSHSYVA